MMVVSASHASPLRAVHVGVAGRGEWPLRLMAADERWRSVGLVDVNTDNLARACTMTGLATDACFPDLAEALRAVPADAVVVVTPSALHGRFIRLALEAGKHVLVEKPFVHQLAEAEELVALAEAQHRQIVVAQQYRFNVQQRALHAALASGEFGTPGYATMVHHRRRPDPRAFTMPHAMLVEMSVHHFDDMRAVFGREAEAISARSFDPPWSRYQGGAVTAAITFAGGLEVAYAGAFTSVDDLFEWRIECERGALCWDAGGLYARLPGGGRQELAAEQGPRPEQVVLDHFTAAVLSGAPTPISGKANLGTLALIAAAIHSGQDGQRAAIAHSHPQS
jgi:predicted dehydrogenase